MPHTESSKSEQGERCNFSRSLVEAGRVCGSGAANDGMARLDESKG